MKPIQINSFAKINRTLQVGKRRPDGYHELLTIYQSISLCDRITLHFTDDRQIHVAVSGSGAPAGESNLAFQAAAFWRQVSGIPTGIRIHLEKTIPSGGGLGGGSSNAAAVLMGLNAYFDHPVSQENLYRIATDLGSDVPFFLTGGTALGTGRGERIRPMPDARPLHLMLVVPAVPFPTERMYGLLDDHEYHGQLPEDAQLDEYGLGSNTFELVVERMSLDIARFMDGVREAGLRVLLSGSGSTVIIAAPTHDMLPDTKALHLPEDWHTVPARTLTRDEVPHVAHA